MVLYNLLPMRVDMIKLKKQLVDMVVARLNVLLENAARSKEVARQDNEEAEGAMQTRFGTAKEEAEYAMEGQAKIVTDTLTSIDALERLKAILREDDVVQVGSVVQVVSEEDETVLIWYFIVPGGAGEEYEINEVRYIAVNYKAPVGKALMGKEEGDVVQLMRNRVNVDFEVVVIE